MGILFAIFILERHFIFN